MALKYTRFTMNLSPVSKRYETLDGKKYLVVPAVMLTEGVHAGSQGPLLYLSDELGKNPGTWNHKPIVVNHPMLNGEGISACDPGVVATQSVGLLFNTGWQDKLKTECWFDEEKLGRVDPRVLTAIENDQMMEVSTGLFHEPETKDGVWNGESYKGIVRNIQGDHLAVLPDQIGACSIEKGAGLLRNSEGVSYGDVREQAQSLLREYIKGLKQENGDSLDYYPYCYVCDVFPSSIIYEMGSDYYEMSYKVKDGKVVLTGEPTQVRRVTSYITANSHRLNSSGRSDAVRNALSEQYPDAGRLYDVSATKVIWNHRGQLVDLSYTQVGDIIRFEGEPQAIQELPSMTVRLVNNNLAQTLGGGNNPGQQGQKPTRKEQVDHLIKTHGWEEKDRGWLETQISDQHFESIIKAANSTRSTTTTLPTLTTPEPTPAPVTTLAQVPVAYPVGGGQLTRDQWMQLAPPDVQEGIREAMAVANAEKDRLIGVITNNQNNRFHPDWLKQRTMDELRGFAALAGNQPQRPVQNYGGQADTVPMFLPGYGQQQITTNAEPGQDEGMDIPELDFSEAR
jgi:hypothetical protein